MRSFIRSERARGSTGAQEQAMYNEDESHAVIHSESLSTGWFCQEVGCTASIPSFLVMMGG